MRGPRGRRLPFLATAVAVLLLGGAAGLSRVGVPMPLVDARLLTIHGPLLVLGFLGTLIALERAVSLRRRWALLSPGLCGAGALCVMTSLPISVGAGLITAGMLGLVAVFVAIARRQWNLAVALLTASSGAGAVAAFLWAAATATEILVAWLAVFIVLAILGERWEFARLRAPGRQVLPFVVLIDLVVIGAALTPVAGLGARLLGAALLGTVLWLLPRDIARRTLRVAGTPRFSAAGVYFAYASLTLAAATMLVSGSLTLGPGSDIVIHGIFVGFAMSMVMAHAPIILPAILGTAVRFSRAVWFPLLILQASLALRYLARPADSHALLVAGGIGNAVGILSFLLLAVITLVDATRGRDASRAAGSQARRLGTAGTA